MRKIACGMLVLYLGVLFGVIIDLPGALGSVVRLVQYPALLAWGLSTLIVTRRLRRPHAFHWLFFAFCVWNVLSLAWSVSPADTTARILRYTVLFVASLAFWDIGVRERYAKGITQILVLAGYLLVAMSVYGHHVGSGKVLDANRFGAGGMDPNDMAIALAMLVPVAWGQALNSDKRFSLLRFANLVFPLIALVGIVLSGSRGALLASVPGFIYVLATLPRVPAVGRAGLIAVAALVIAVGSRMDLSYQLGRLGTAVSAAESGELSGREQIWQAGQDVLRRNPILGVGGAAFPESIRAYPEVPRHPVTGEPYVAHNTYLSVAVETGAVGFTLFVSALLTVAWGVLRRGDRIERGSWLTAFLIWAAGASSVTWDYRPYTWLFFLAGLILVSRRRVPAAVPAATAQDLSSVSPLLPEVA